MRNLPKSESVLTWLRHGAIYGLAAAIHKAGSILLLPLYSFYLSKSDFGILDLVIITNALLLLLFQFGIGSAILRTVGLTEFAVEAIFSTSIKFIVVSGVIGGGLVFYFSEPVAKSLLGNSEFSGLIQLSAGILSCSLITVVVTAYLRISERPIAFAIWQTAGFLTEVIAAIIFLFFFEMGIKGIILATLLKFIVLVLWGLVLLAPGINGRFSFPALRSMLRFGLPLVPASVGMFVLNLSNRYFLRAWSSMEQIGIFSIGYKIALVVALLVNAMQMAWPPVMYRLAKQETGPKQYAKFTITNLTIFILLGAWLSLFSPEILWILTNGKFVEAAGIIPLIVLAYVFQGLYYMLNIGLNVRAKTEYEPIIVAGAMAANIALNVLLIPRYGMWGAAVATVIAYIVLTISADRVSQRLFPAQQNYPKIAVLLFSFLVIMAISNLFSPHISIHFILYKLIIFLCFILYLSRIVHFQIFQMIRAFTKTGKEAA